MLRPVELAAKGARRRSDRCLVTPGHYDPACTSTWPIAHQWRRLKKIRRLDKEIKALFAGEICVWPFVNALQRTANPGPLGPLRWWEVVLTDSISLIHRAGTRSKPSSQYTHRTIWLEKALFSTVIQEKQNPRLSSGFCLHRLWPRGLVLELWDWPLWQCHYAFVVKHKYKAPKEAPINILITSKS